MRYEVSGVEAGEPMVLVHGWCCSRRDMAGLGELLAERWRVYLVDLPGFGESARLPVGVEPTFAAYAEALAGFLEERDLRGVALVGHSMGGVLSVMAAGLVPERVSAVVNLDGAIPMLPSARAGYAGLFARIEREGFTPTMRAFLPEAFFLPRERGTPEMERILAEMLSAPEDLAAALLAHIPEVEGVGPLSRCKARLLYVTGSRPRYDEAAVRALRPATRFASVGECGHFVQVFARERVAALVREFLGG